MILRIETGVPRVRMKVVLEILRFITRANRHIVLYVYYSLRDLIPW